MSFLTEELETFGFEMGLPGTGRGAPPVTGRRLEIAANFSPASFALLP
jgi:hypothetical protein